MAASCSFRSASATGSQCATHITSSFSLHNPCLLPPQLHLISSRYRSGMSKHSSVGASPLPASPWIIFDVHGGGFVAMSSKTHCAYLYPLAIETNVPVVCVNYSLAPQTQYPAQLHQVTCDCRICHASACCAPGSPWLIPLIESLQVLSSYFWARKNCAALGWTGEHACALGDSAGVWDGREVMLQV